MSRTIPQRELRNQNAHIIDAVASGATFIITRNGEPVAELRPLARGRRHLVPKGEVSAVAAAGPHIDAREFRRDLEEAVDQSLNG